MSPGAPLTYSNDKGGGGGGGERVIFWGQKFWPKVIFWVYEKPQDYLGCKEKTNGFFLGCEKGLRVFWGMLKKVVIFFFWHKI